MNEILILLLQLGAFGLIVISAMLYTLWEADHTSTKKKKNKK